MKFKFALAALAATLSISLLGAAGASAATEFGDTCVADRGTAVEGGTKATVFGLNSSSSPFPLAAPSAGVITSWKLNLISPPPPQAGLPPIIPQTLKVLRLNPAAKIATVIGESSGLVGSGLNTIPARIPVQPGDRLGLFGEGLVSVGGPPGEIGTLYCEETATPADVIGAALGTAPVGGSFAYEEGAGSRVPAFAVLEPDADNDGFGDETQDKCPQSAAAQVACPVVQLSTSVTKGKKAVTIAITGTSAATVTVNGKAPLGKGKKAKLKGGTKAVTPGALTKFRLKFPAKLTKRIEELSPSKKLTLKVTVSAPNVAAAPTKKVIKVKLKGQGQKA